MTSLNLPFSKRDFFSGVSGVSWFIIVKYFFVKFLTKSKKGQTRGTALFQKNANYWYKVSF